jgi:hypothetical protein
MKREQKITLGEMRSSGGATRLLVYCSDFKCSSLLSSYNDRPSHRQANRTTPVLLISTAFVPLLAMAGLWVLG